MTTPIPEPPAGTAVVGGQQLYQYPPIVPGINSSTVPSVSAPAVAASTTGVTNSLGVDVAVYAVTGSGVTVSKVQVNGGTLGTTMAASSGALIAYLPAGQTITLTYAGGTPTWAWQAV